MKLGEALLLKEQLLSKLNHLKEVLTNGPDKLISETLSECNNVLNNYKDLELRILETEKTASIDNNTINQLRVLCEMVDKKISLFESILLRQGLTESKIENIYNQLSNYRSTRDTLLLSLEKCFWETDLL